jgi:hypothetical protein
MVARITYQDDLVAGQQFTAAMADEIHDVVNGLGTAADANTGTTAGCVPVIGVDGYLPSAIIPGGGGGGGGTGDVVGPASVTDGRPALFDGTTGKLIKQAAATQILPVSGTNGYWLTYTADAPAWATTISLATALEALTTTDRIAYTGIDGLDSSGAGALFEDALIAKSGATASQVVAVNSGATGFEGRTLGSASLLDAVPTGAPATASSTAGAITLTFTGIADIETTTTEAITSVTVTVEAYRWVIWTVIQTTARNITFPAATVISGTGGSLTHTGVANSTTRFLIYKRNTTLHVIVGDSAVVGV